MEASKQKICKDYLGVIFSTSFSNVQIDLIKDRTISIDERKDRLNKILSEKQKYVLSEFKRINNSGINDFSFLNHSLLDEYDYRYIIDQIVI